MVLAMALLLMDGRSTSTLLMLLFRANRAEFPFLILNQFDLASLATVLDVKGALPARALVANLALGAMDMDIELAPVVKVKDAPLATDVDVTLAPFAMEPVAKIVTLASVEVL